MPLALPRIYYNPTDNCNYYLKRYGVQLSTGKGEFPYYDLQRLDGSDANISIKRIPHHWISVEIQPGDLWVSRSIYGAAKARCLSPVDWKIHWNQHARSIDIKYIRYWGDCRDANHRASLATFLSLYRKCDI